MHNPRIHSAEFAPKHAGNLWSDKRVVTTMLGDCVRGPGAGDHLGLRIRLVKRSLADTAAISGRIDGSGRNRTGPFNILVVGAATACAVVIRSPLVLVVDPEGLKAKPIYVFVEDAGGRAAVTINIL